MPKVKIAVYLNPWRNDKIEQIFAILTNLQQRFDIRYSFHESMVSAIGSTFGDVDVFYDKQKVKDGHDLFLTFGGDGTVLHSVQFFNDFKTPLMAINIGRLGFLTHCDLDIAEKEIADVLEGHTHTVQKKTVLRWANAPEDFKNADQNFALNDITIHKKGNSILGIHVFVNEQKLNTYWTDGIIFATPTGSTAYSLSCGGPVLSPDSPNFVITPIAPHNLNVRPLVVPDDTYFKIQVEAREGSFLVTCDNRTLEIAENQHIEISKLRVCLPIIQSKKNSFFDVLRKKLLWGADSRN